MQWKDLFRLFLAVLILSFTFVFVYAMAFKPFPEANKDFIMAGFGFSAPLATLVVQFFFRKAGTSSDSNNIIEPPESKPKNRR